MPKIVHHLDKESIEETQTVMEKSVENLKEILEADDKIPDNDSCYHIHCCNCLDDGTWQKRHKF